MAISNKNIRRDIDRLEAERVMLQGRLKESPDGELTCAKNGKGYKWYIYRNGKKEYLPKENLKLAKQLAFKKYLKLKIRDIKVEMNGLKDYLRSQEKIASYKLNAKTFFEHAEYARLVSEYFVPANKELDKWQNAEYERCIKNPEHLIIKGTGGKMLRSKSEALIDLLLYTNNIPFRYEDRMTMEGINVYPDFTIRHPVSGEMVIWEHFGLMDDSLYAEKAFEKMKLYARHGFVPGINLIATFETTSKPLSTEEVSWYIEKFFGLN